MRSTPWVEPSGGFRCRLPYNVDNHRFSILLHQEQKIHPSLCFECRVGGLVEDVKDRDVFGSILSDVTVPIIGGSRFQKFRPRLAVCRIPVSFTHKSDLFQIRVHAAFDPRRIDLVSSFDEIQVGLLYFRNIYFAGLLRHA